MNKLALQHEDSTNLSPISFINDVKNQLKIRDIDTDSSEFRNRLGVFFTKTHNLLGIKEHILDINKVDIMEMLLMRFKGLSLEEIEYSFKMERFGNFGKKIEHFQLFNADYVSRVLDRYTEWKNFKNKTYNLKKQEVLVEISESEKKRIVNEAVIEFYNHFKENRTIDVNRIYLYNVFYGMDLLAKDNETKNSIKKDAVDIVRMDLLSRKPTSLEEKRGLKVQIEGITNPKNSSVITKCKELSIEDYFRSLKTKEQEDEFLNLFKI